MKLICYSGLPGTGKTYAAKKMELSIGAIRLSRDDIRIRLFEHPLFTEDEKTVVFKVMLELARYYLLQKKDVILDGMPFSKRSERDAAGKLAYEIGADLELYHCVCKDETALERIASQSGNHPAMDRGEDLYYRVKSKFEPFDAEENAIELITEYI